ncbi:MAG: tRNA (5-methylaminomethyl-2-thiouridylate)-methyltransferase [Bacteroidota bacterium]|nr:tRNA (5-methylaminomethyl-2-thiouridylate)-methyltransferase [Bacteroidota bacterium]
MATITTNFDSAASEATGHVYRVRELLHWTYGLVPIVAGADKFAHLLTNWDKYLAPAVADILPFAPHTFMLIVGVVEIIAGIIVLVKPKIGSLIVGCWLIGIVINLLIQGEYLDVAVRDAVMAIGAFALYMLSDNVKHHVA